MPEQMNRDWAGRHPIVKGVRVALFDFIKAAAEKLFPSRDLDTASATLASAPDDGAAKARVEAAATRTNTR